MLVVTGGFVLIRDDILRSNDLWVGFEPSPRACRGGEQEKIVTLRFCNTRVGFSQAPEHVDGEGL
jgi:hypothetical protein